MEHRDGEGVADKDEVEDDAGGDELEDDAWKHCIKKWFVDNKDEVEDDVLKFDAHKHMEPLLAVCFLAKNREDEGDKRRSRGRWREKMIHCLAVLNFQFLKIIVVKKLVAKNFYKMYLFFLFLNLPPFLLPSPSSSWFFTKQHRSQGQPPKFHIWIRFRSNARKKFKTMLWSIATEKGLPTRTK